MPIPPPVLHSLPMTTFSVMQETDYHDAYALWTATAGMGLRSLDDSPNGIATFLARNPRTSFVGPR